MKTTTLGRAVCAVAVMLLCAGAASNDPPPDWAFFGMKKGPELPKDKLIKVVGSKLSLTAKQIAEANYVVDWFPEDHPKAPDSVQRGRPKDKAYACAGCHDLNGVGESDNAALAGLPADYIVQQFAEFRPGRRTCPVAKAGCADAMPAEAKAVTDAEARAAAEYFANTPYRKRITVVERAMVPKPELVWYTWMALKGGRLEPIGDRIIETPDSLQDYLAANWRAPMTAYVPPGSIARGKALVDSGAGAAPCASCHGAKLQGAGLIPPLAGRPPSYLYRQLYDIQYGFRKGPAVAPMLPEVVHLTAKDRLAIVAYLASLKE